MGVIDDESDYREWPQEKPEYFKLKQEEKRSYVRNDKFSLSLMCEVFTAKVNVDRRRVLPPMSSAYVVRKKN